VIDMVYGKMSAQKVKELSLNINDIVRRVAEENASLQEITKEYLGEELSEDVLKEIITQETLNQISNKLTGILNGK
tara:strand:- start:10208 stop:10435 length:228 start_codon:yes stop_codon:yes gene_type:complete